MPLLSCSFHHEKSLQASGFLRVAGVDEAGRGPLAGPVVVAAVVFPPGCRVPEDLTDSKKLSARRRDHFFEILSCLEGVERSVVVMSPDTIDRINILEATREGMRLAVNQLTRGLAEHALIDGLPVPRFPCAQTALVGGDGLSLSIAAASVLAKVTRDRLMLEAAATWPQYGFEKHKGYATVFHLARLRQYGPCPIHRRSFSPVVQPELFPSSDPGPC